jgi:putative ABC transport system ATP-binding protein
VSLLALQRVAKRYRDGQLERVVLRDVSLQIDSGELTVVWGLRGCGRSTLLRVAAGIEAPDDGVVLFEGRDLASHGEDVLGAGIGYCQKNLGSGSQIVLDVVMVALLAAGVSPSQARSRACEALERARVASCATLRVSALDTAEAVRVALARVLAQEPRLLVIDDPIRGVDLLERDGILALLRSLAHGGIAVLASTSEATGLSGADRTLALSTGELRGPAAAELAPVVALRRAPLRQAGI